MLTPLFSSFHLLALGIGLGAVWARGRALDRGDVPAVLKADTWWGIAAVLWLATGLSRAFGGLEKGTAFYLANPWFHVKMTLFALIWLLEAWPMVTFIRWRTGVAPDTRRFPVFRRLNDAELVLVVLMVFVAGLMARGGRV